MIELEPVDYNVVLKFFPHLKCDTVLAYAIAGRTQKGRIFVDHLTDPTVALIWHVYGSALLMGDSNNHAFNEHIKELLFSRYEGVQKKINIGIDNAEWKLKIEQMLESHLYYCTDIREPLTQTIEKAKSNILGKPRLRHRFNRDKFYKICNNISPVGQFTLRKIDNEIYSKISGRVVPGSFWDSPRTFLEKGAGYCLMDGDKVACASFSAYIGNGQVDVGIETTPEYRRLGLGAVTAAAMVKHVLENGAQPVWGCLQENAGSAAIAEKIAFEAIGTHMVYSSIG
jgi:GNAT superfamily N-acetyltransferase